MEEQVVVDRFYLESSYEFCLKIYKENRSKVILGKATVFADLLGISDERFAQDFYE